MKQSVQSNVATPVRLIALDLVRFFAALSVVMYHYTARPESNSFEMVSEVTRYGYLGVPLFFIISGYVIALSANNRSAIEFAISRFVRLYPAFWCGIAFTILISSLFGQNHYSLGQILANLTMLNDYLGYENVDGVYWTLQAELKFYACVFLLISFGIFEKFRIWLSVWLGLTTLHLLTNQPVFMGWFISPSYSSMFMGGVAFYLVQKEGRNKFNLFILISSLVISSYFGFSQAAGFMKDPGTVNRSIAVMLIWVWYILFYLLVTERVHVPRHSYYLTIGGLTYPLYLIHATAGYLIIDNLKGLLSEGGAVTISIILMLLISYLIQIRIEKKVATPMKAQLLNLHSAMVSFLKSRWSPKRTFGFKVGLKHNDCLGNSDSSIRDRLDLPPSLKGGEPEDHGDKENKTESRGGIQGQGGIVYPEGRQDVG